MGAFEHQSSSRNGTTQAVAYTGTAATITNAFGGETWQLRLAANSACHYVISEAASVTVATVTNGAFLPANWVEYVSVTPGQKISVIRAATDGLVTATSGTLLVTELS